jgi:hypothetical protein
MNKMNCYNHPGRDASGTCKYCGRLLCSECLLKKSDYYCCKNSDDCLEYQESLDSSSKPLPLERSGYEEYMHLMQLYIKQDVKLKRFPFAVVFAIVFLCFSFLAAKIMRSPPEPIGQGAAVIVAIIVFVLSIFVTKRIIKKLNKDENSHRKGWKK